MSFPPAAVASTSSSSSGAAAAAVSSPRSLGCSSVVDDDDDVVPKRTWSGKINEPRIDMTARVENFNESDSFHQAEFYKLMFLEQVDFKLDSNRINNQFGFVCKCTNNNK